MGVNSCLLQRRTSADVSDRIAEIFCGETAGRYGPSAIGKYEAKSDEQGSARSAGTWRDRKLVSRTLETTVRPCVRRPARGASARCGVRPGRHPLRSGLETR